MFTGLSPFLQRLYVSIAVIALCSFLVYFSHTPFFEWLFVASLAAVIGTALWEYYQIAKAKGFQPLVKLGIFASLSYMLAIFTNLHNSSLVTALPLALLFLVLLLFFLYSLYSTDSHPLTNLAVTLFGFAYITMTLTCLLNINYFFPGGSQDGRLWIFYAIAVTKMTDVGGYVVGKKIGGKLLAPVVSPKKTLSGAVGGFLFAIASSMLLTAILNGNMPEAFSLSIVHSIWLGGLIGIIAQVGDLAESILKRDGGIKDSNKLPGLGGVLDVMDSLIFTIPLVYVFILWSYS